MKNYIYRPGKSEKLTELSTIGNGEYENKKEASEKILKNMEVLSDLQERLYAYNKYSLLIVLQAMDTAGKDGMVRHVMKGLNPTGCYVKSFKAPNNEELNHDFLWRCMRALPERGLIGIFNRSYYEEVLIARVHKQLLENSKIPGLPEDPQNDPNFWKERYKDINNFEKYLFNNGTIILKFFLHISKKEQKDRLISRIDDPKKNWKFSESDLNERHFWNQYIQAYQDMLDHTSVDDIPWYVIPSDNKWFSRVLVSNIITATLKSLKLSYPVVSVNMKKILAESRKLLEKD